jgi:hypothetical protein
MRIDRLLNDLFKLPLAGEARQDLINTQHFLVDNVADYLYHQTFQEYFDWPDFPNIAPCYNFMSFEFSNPQYTFSTEKGFQKYPEFVKGEVVLIKSWKLDPPVKMTHREERPIKWICKGAHFYEFKFSPKWLLTDDSHFGKPLVEITWAVDESGMGAWLTPKGNLYAIDPIAIEALKDNTFKDDLISLGPFYVPFLALSFLHCKNVIMNTIEPPSALNLSRLKEQKLPLLKYHILDIKPMKTIIAKEGNIEKNGLRKALHFCRGHFKDFSQGDGLFGKYKGLYWWESQVRGNIDRGVVEKDYRIFP